MGAWFTVGQARLQEQSRVVVWVGGAHGCMPRAVMARPLQPAPEEEGRGGAPLLAASFVGSFMACRGREGAWREQQLKLAGARSSRGQQQQQPPWQGRLPVRGGACSSSSSWWARGLAAPLLWRGQHGQSGGAGGCVPASPGRHICPAPRLLVCSGSAGSGSGSGSAGDAAEATAASRVRAHA